jgi:hypothetical protein
MLHDMREAVECGSNARIFLGGLEVDPLAPYPLRVVAAAPISSVNPKKVRSQINSSQELLTRSAL